MILVSGQQTVNQASPPESNVSNLNSEYSTIQFIYFNHHSLQVKRASPPGCNVSNLNSEYKTIQFIYFNHHSLQVKSENGFPCVH